MKIAIIASVAFISAYWFIAGLIRSMIGDIKNHSAFGMWLRALITLAIFALLQRCWL